MKNVYVAVSAISNQAVRVFKHKKAAMAYKGRMYREGAYVLILTLPYDKDRD